MGVPYRLAGPGPGIEHHPVIGDPGVGGHLPGLVRDLVQQPAAGLRHCCDVGQVLTWYYQDMHGRLGTYVAERDGPLALQHPVSRQIARNDLAKEALWHGKILTCSGFTGPPTYMVTVREPTMHHPSGARAMSACRRRGCVAKLAVAAMQSRNGGMGGKCERW